MRLAAHVYSFTSKVAVTSSSPSADTVKVHEPVWYPLMITAIAVPLYEVEADFLVNIMEDSLSKEAALNAHNNIFRTECGKKICKEMFGLF